ncbi:ERI1 exoribonuclease 3 isoform X2 [Gymnogyps californianus]|uniref:ERI1 exoribonuclease 3 isoform X2 n=1 Tax=Gymnogyps californianus TaxID=33616 RepID=UPI0021C9467F|nr:ERI1 exoribonuclease 3 isoform X2 [Gymnogyps californianus]
MIALLHTGATKFPQTLLPRARQAVCSLLPAGVLKGYSSIVSRKLASHGFGASMAAMSSFPPQRYHYFLVLDFEATCDKPQIHPQEIIEFPILKLNGRTMEIESTFHMYVQPVVHPQLTPFCTELTGIIQGMVDGQPSLQQVLERVDEWMAKEGLLDPSVKSIFVTCGDWDLKVMLPGQCQYLGLPVADYFKQWINLKKFEAPGFGVLGAGIHLNVDIHASGCSSRRAFMCWASANTVILR